METISQIRQFIFTEAEPGINVKSTTNKDNLIEEGIIDSLLILKLMAYLKEKFGIALSDDELDPENFASIEKINNLIKEKLEN